MTLDPSEIQKEIMKLPPDKQGDLKDLKDKYTSIKLQKSAWEHVD